MPSVTPSSQTIIDTFEHAIDLPPPFLAALRQDPTNANLILPLVEKELVSESSRQIWISCTSYHPHPDVELVLSCTGGETCIYPIFIITTKPFHQLSSEFLEPRLEAMVKSLHDIVPPERVFSIFAPEPISQIFAQFWTELTGVRTYTEPYYAAKLSFCTSRTFINRSLTMQPDVVYDLRPATSDDLTAVTELCFGFAKESEPFILTWEGAVKEAGTLIRNEQVWVHEIRIGSAPPEIACLAAFTRNTSTTATITKVFTNPRSRSRGCAQRLVRRVCKHLLSFKESVALYVAHDNLAAAKVYARVGFVGLDPHSEPVEGVDPWTEIGFDREQVELGHW